MVTQPTTMSLSSEREYLQRIHGHYQRAGREHKRKILDEFCAVFGYHRKFACACSTVPCGGGVPAPSLVMMRSGCDRS